MFDLQKNKSPFFFSFVRTTMTTPCIVCYRPVNSVTSPGLVMGCCEQVVCETCMQILAEHCPICDRNRLNKVIDCENCSEPTKMHNSRVCDVCEDLCCIQCSEKLNCCVNTRTNGIICVHCVCTRC